MKSIIFSLFFVLFLVQGSFAFDCSSLNSNLQEDCSYLNDFNETLISNLVYTFDSFPNHDFVHEYNSKIEIDIPFDNIPVYYKGVIENAWIKILTIEPSVIYKNTLYVKPTINPRAEFDYEIVVPEDYYSDYKRDGRTCKIKYYLDSQSESFNWYANSLNIGSDKEIFITVINYDTLTAKLTISATIKEKRYEWDRYCCRRNSEGSCIKRCYDCDYDKTSYKTYSLTISDSISIKPYIEPTGSSFTIFENYGNTYKGNLTVSPNVNTLLSTENSRLVDNQLVFAADFINSPYYFLQLKVENENSKASSNLFVDDNILYLNNVDSCSTKTTDFFRSETKECVFDIKPVEYEPFEQKKFNSNWNLFFKVVIFLLIVFLLYKLIKKYWGKLLIQFAMLIIFIPLVSAESCGLSNLGSCIPQKIYEFFLDLMNAPLVPLLDFTKKILEAHPNIEIFQGIWGIMVYVLSMFFGLLFIYSGFQFLFSGHNVIKREIAKQWLKNTIIMIVLIQGSFYLYDLIIQLGSVMTSSVLTMVDPTFFLLTADNMVNMGLQFLFVTLYAVTLLFTILFLGMRYLMVAFGVIFLPFGIFCYFIPPLRSYGKLIINILLINIFVVFIDAIIILASSMMIDIPLFANIKILLMINCFAIINILFFILLRHVIIKSSAGEGAEKIAEAAKYIAMFA